MKNNVQDINNGSQAFTLLEVMIAIAIFGLFLLYASQFMRSEIRVFDSASKQNEVEQKARVAMMHILDEVRLNNFTFYKSSENSQGIYCYANAASALLKDDTDSTCLIFVSLELSSVTPPPSTRVFFDKSKGELCFLKNDSPYLIADEISQLNIKGESSSEEGESTLVKIEIKVGQDNGSESFQLQSWVRLN